MEAYVYRCRYYRPTGESDWKLTGFLGRLNARTNYQLLMQSHTESENYPFFSKPGQFFFCTCQCCINWFCFDPNPLSSFRRRYSVVLGLTKIGVLDSRRPVANNVQSFDRISECANWVWDLWQMTTAQTDVVTISFECCLCMFMFLSLNFVLKPQYLHDWPPIFKVPFIWE